MAHQDLSKGPVLIEANAGEEPPAKKQKTNLLPPSLELAQAMLSLRRRPFVSSPSPTLFPTACNIEKTRKRGVVSIDNLTAISDDEGDTPMNYCNHAVRREGTTDFQLSTTYGLSIAPVPIGRPLAAAPSLPRYAPGQVAPTKTAIGK
jgi:hypothetical protein